MSLSGFCSPTSFIDNEQELKKPLYQQVYADLDSTQDDCNFARAVFQKEYGLADTDIIQLHSESKNYCDKLYKEL